MPSARARAWPVDDLVLAVDSTGHSTAPGCCRATQRLEKGLLALPLQACQTQELTSAQRQGDGLGTVGQSDAVDRQDGLGSSPARMSRSLRVDAGHQLHQFCRGGRLCLQT